MISVEDSSLCLWLYFCLSCLQQEASDRQSRLEEEQRTLADALTAADRRATEEKGI